MLFRSSVVYADEGDGPPGRSVWAAPTSPIGNVYVLDIFVNKDRDAEATAAQVASDFIVSWLE